MIPLGVTWCSCLPQPLFRMHTHVYAMTNFFALPRRDQELAIAVRVLDHESSLDLDILHALVGEPKRYTDLKPFLKGRNDTVLNRALIRLRDDGVIEQRLDVARKQRIYGLTELGKLVYARIQQMRPYHDGIRALQRGHDALVA